MNNPEKPDNSEQKQSEQVACEVYSRIVGYLRPVQDWGPGKQVEFADRKVYDMEVKP